MTKCICALLVTLTSMMNADYLIDAINAYDVAMVEHIIQNKTYTPSKYMLYTAAAREAVEQCRNEGLIQTLKPSGYAPLEIASVICAVLSYTQIYGLYNIGIPFELNRHNIDTIKSFIGKFMGINVVAAALFGIGVAIRSFEIQDTYDAAVKIQQLILEIPYG